MKTIVMSFFILLSTFITGFAYDQWTDQLEDEQFSNVIELSQKNFVVQNITSPSNNTLVPDGVFMGSNDVTTIYYAYLVQTEENVDLNVSLDKAFFVKDGVEYLDDYGLLVFNYNFEKYSSTETLVTVAINLNMPENKEQYDLVYQSQISFDLVFNQNEL